MLGDDRTAQQSRMTTTTAEINANLIAQRLATIIHSIFNKHKRDLETVRLDDSMEFKHTIQLHKLTKSKLAKTCKYVIEQGNIVVANFRINFDQQILDEIRSAVARMPPHLLPLGVNPIAGPAGPLLNPAPQPAPQPAPPILPNHNPIPENVIIRHHIGPHQQLPIRARPARQIRRNLLRLAAPGDRIARNFIVADRNRTAQRVRVLTALCRIFHELQWQVTRNEQAFQSALEHATEDLRIEDLNLWLQAAVRYRQDGQQVRQQGGQQGDQQGGQQGGPCMPVNRAMRDAAFQVFRRYHQAQSEEGMMFTFLCRTHSCCNFEHFHVQVL